MFYGWQDGGLFPVWLSPEVFLHGFQLEDFTGAQSPRFGNGCGVVIVEADLHGEHHALIGFRGSVVLCLPGVQVNRLPFTEICRSFIDNYCEFV